METGKEANVVDGGEETFHSLEDELFLGDDPMGHIDLRDQPSSSSSSSSSSRSSRSRNSSATTTASSIATPVDVLTLECGKCRSAAQGWRSLEPAPTAPTAPIAPTALSATPAEGVKFTGLNSRAVEVLDLSTNLNWDFLPPGWKVFSCEYTSSSSLHMYYQGPNMPSNKCIRSLTQVKLQINGDATAPRSVKRKTHPGEDVGGSTESDCGKCRAKAAAAAQTAVKAMPPSCSFSSSVAATQAMTATAATTAVALAMVAAKDASAAGTTALAEHKSGAQTANAKEAARANLAAPEVASAAAGAAAMALAITAGSIGEEKGLAVETTADDLKREQSGRGGVSQGVEARLFGSSDHWVLYASQGDAARHLVIGCASSISHCVCGRAQQVNGYEFRRKREGKQSDGGLVVNAEPWVCKHCQFKSFSRVEVLGPFPGHAFACERHGAESSVGSGGRYGGGDDGAGIISPIRVKRTAVEAAAEVRKAHAQAAAAAWRTSGGVDGNEGATKADDERKHQHGGERSDGVAGNQVTVTGIHDPVSPPRPRTGILGRRLYVKAATAEALRLMLDPFIDSSSSSFFFFFIIFFLRLN